MNLIKSKLRNRMQLPMLSSILAIRSGLTRESKCCYNYVIPNSVLKDIKTTKTYQCNAEEMDGIEDVLLTENLEH